MTTKDLWQLFVETGAPEFYLLYNRSKEMECKDVPDDTSPCSARDGLQ